MSTVVDYFENFATWIVALLTGFFTAVVSVLGGADFGQTFYDVLTVVAAALAVHSGAVIVSQQIKDTRLTRKDILAGDIWTIGACIVILTTGVSAYHVVLMLFWSFADGPEVVGPEVNAAFENWHILASFSLWVLHLWMKRAMNWVDQMRENPRCSIRPQ